MLRVLRVLEVLEVLREQAVLLVYVLAVVEGAAEHLTLRVVKGITTAAAVVGMAVTTEALPVQVEALL